MKPVYDEPISPRKDNNMPSLSPGTHRDIVVIDDEVAKSIIDETDPNCVYICEASCGVGEDAPYWQIQRIVTAGSVVTIEWADGDGKYDNIASDRATLTYR